MKNLSLILFSVLLLSCGKKYETTGEGEVLGADVATVKIDSCEYVVARGLNSVAIVHKANCKNHSKFYIIDKPILTETGGSGSIDFYLEPSRIDTLTQLTH